MMSKLASRRVIPVPQTVRGLSLIELMIAITIGLIITAAVAQLFVTSRSAYTMEENMARVQENGRFAMQFLADDIRMAGYAGCSSKLKNGTPSGGNCPQGTICSIAQPTNAATTFDSAGLKGYKYTGSGTNNAGDWTPALPADYFPNTSTFPNPEPGTDVFAIQRADDLDTHLTGNTTPSNANVQILNTSNLASKLYADEILMVSDCKGGDIIRANNISQSGNKTVIAHSNSVNSGNFLTHAYGNDAQVMQLVSRVYFVGKGTSGEPALVRRDWVKTGLVTQELVEGVEDMRIKYGEDTDATADLVPNIYEDPASVSNWRNVVTVRVGLLVHTLNKVDREPGIAKFNLAGTTVGPFGDNLRRSAFNSTIRIRSR